VITTQEKLRERTKKFALDVIQLTRLLPQNTEGWVLGKQLLRSGTSVAANYRAAGRGRSRSEFVAKIGIVVEEADETVFWLELLDAAGIVDHRALAPVLAEANQLLRIFSASHRTAKESLHEDHPITRS
jgi:four helix bundle protein